MWIGALRLATDPDEPDDAASPYRLLAQFTADQDANIEIADGGAIYFVINREDLAAGRYEQIAVHMESH